MEDNAIKMYQFFISLYIQAINNLMINIDLNTTQHIQIVHQQF